jgi:putative SOS response-associated peptidase YedK
MQRFNAEMSGMLDYNPTEFCSAFDFPATPVIIDEKPQEIQLFNWGLVPAWSQDLLIRKYTLNARIETLYEKRSFKEVVSNRCLILADGFYEWQWLTKSGSKKNKYLITLPNEALFGFAGIYSQWQDFDGAIFNSYSIVTTEANDLMSEIHNTKKRMPVIVKKEDEAAWLEGAPVAEFAFPYETQLEAIALDKTDEGQLGLFD